MQAAFFTDQPHLIDRVFGGGRREQIENEIRFYPEIITTANFAGHAPALRELEVIFSTWGMPQLSVEEVRALPALKVVFYAAGSVQYFARPFLECGVQVVSAWAAGAVPVAQFTLAQIILAAKGYFAAERLSRTPEGRSAYATTHPGLFGATVSLLGAGMIGARVAQLLQQVGLDRPGEVQILVYDPFLSEERAASLGVEKVSLEAAFERGIVVSNHIADLPETRGLITRDLFERMRPHATFINTGRGATIDEHGMLEVLASRPDLTALLDVTFPEPPLPDSPIYRLENVVLSPHIAGSIGNELWRQADYVIEEWRRYRDGQNMRYTVTLEMLRTMA